MSWRYIAAGINFIQVVVWSTATPSATRSHKVQLLDATKGRKWDVEDSLSSSAEWMSKMEFNSLLQTWMQHGLEPESPFVEKDSILLEKDDPDIVSFHYNVTEWLALAPRKPKNITITGGGQFNLCMSDRFVPEFFVIGVVKAGTTSFSSDLRMSSSFLWPKQPLSSVTRKEGHFFDEHYYKGPWWMAQNYPKCRTDVRIVASDASPRYLMDINVPERISRWYGNMKHDLKFYIVLREPMARFHSDYYHARTTDWCDDFKTMAFDEVIDQILRGNWEKYTGGGGDCRDRLEGSLYKGSIQRWFNKFRPSQFTVVPWMYYVAPGENGRPTRTLAQHVWDALGVQSGFVMKPIKSNGHEHAALAVDLNQTAIMAFQKFLDPWSSPTVLADMFISSPGVKLYDYKVVMPTRKGIAKWISNNW